MRYNQPPNWPPPPAGWTPPLGWQPDPAWGPAPEGWQLWSDDAPGPAPLTSMPSGAKRWLWPALAVLALFVGIGIGAASAGGDDTTTTTTQPDDDEGAPAPTVTVTNEVAGPVTTETVTAKPAGPEDVIDEGQWEVGADVRPGTYKLIEPVSGDCYWAITPVGRPDSIIDNGLPTGGRPTVVLKRGQEFTNQGCGTWGRQ